jgi:predicted nucleic acid-binding protein
VDTSALVALYVPEAFSGPARRAVNAARQVPFTELHHLELTNAFALLLGRGAINKAEHRSVHGQLREDLETQRLLPVALDWAQVFVAARELSEAHTRRFLTRSLDLLHVAAAQVLACRTFASADDRQLSSARAAGLAVVDIKRRVRKGRS